MSLALTEAGWTYAEFPKIPDSVLGANSQGRSDLVLGKVLGANNVEIAKANCAANPTSCVTTPEGEKNLLLALLKEFPIH